MQLEGAVALITGAGSGIGRALAQELSRRGCRVLLLGRRAGELNNTRQMLARPDLAECLPLDLADSEQRGLLAGKVAALTSHLDLLINNAGVVAAGDFATQPEQDWRTMIEVNLLAPMVITQGVLPLLKASGQGRVVNVGSMFGDIAFPCFAAYSASKFALRGWSEALRRELAGDGIGVTYCAPRGTRTAAADGFARYVQAFRMTLDTPEAVAAHLVAGIAREARDIYPMGPERLFALIQRLFPRLIDRGVIGQFRTARQRMDR